MRIIKAEDNLGSLLLELIKFPEETEWLEFKINWFEPKRVGEYISALSNSATICGRKEAYMIWGVSDDHKVVGTDFDYHLMIKNESFEQYIGRQLIPSIGFSFNEILIENKRVVFLVIPRVVTSPTNFNEKRYIKIDSSIENLMKYPSREAQLWDILKNGTPTIINRVSSEQNLKFSKLLLYYAYKGIALNSSTFEKDLYLRTEDGKYNVLARLLADENTMTFRVSIFRGTRKSDVLLSVKEFGNTCLLYSFDKIIDYADTINLIQADEKNRVVERLEQELFNREAYREAILNCFIHNNWVDGNAPMISIFTDRIEILSHGGIPSDQYYSTFFGGISKPVNES